MVTLEAGGSWMDMHGVVASLLYVLCNDVVNDH